MQPSDHQSAVSLYAFGCRTCKRSKRGQTEKHRKRCERGRSTHGSLAPLASSPLCISMAQVDSMPPDLWGNVVCGAHLRQGLHCLGIGYNLLGVALGQPEVGQFEVSRSLNKKVRRLQISAACRCSRQECECGYISHQLMSARTVVSRRQRRAALRATQRGLRQPGGYADRWI